MTTPTNERVLTSTIAFGISDLLNAVVARKNIRVMLHPGTDEEFILTGQIRTFTDTDSGYTHYGNGEKDIRDRYVHVSSIVSEHYVPVMDIVNMIPQGGCVFS